MSCRLRELARTSSLAIVVFHGINSSTTAFPQEEITATEYLESILIDRTESWLAGQIRRFRSYPHLDRAYRLIDQNRLPEARKELEIYLEIEPLGTRARFAYMDLLYRTEDFAEVIRQADIILSGTSDFAPGFIYRGLAHLALGQKDRALEDFEAALERSTATVSDRTFTVNTLADLAIKEGRYDDALQALRAMPSSGMESSFYFRQGICFEALAQLPEASEAYRRALDLAQTSSERLTIYLAIGETAKKRRDWEAAEEAFTSALELEPGNVSLMRALGELAYQQGDFPGAAEWAARVVARDPEPRDREFLAHLLYTLGDYPAAALELDLLLEELSGNQDRARVYMTLGNVLTKSEKHSAASEAYRSALGYKRDLRAVIALAQSLENQGRFPEAILLLEDELAVKTSAEAHQKLAVLYGKSGQPKNALRQLDHAMEAGLPDELQPSARRQAGFIYFELGRYSDAARAFEEAVSLAPDDPYLRSSLARAYAGAGRVHEALALYQELLTKEGQAGDLRASMGYLKVELGRYSAAADHFIEAFETGGEKSWVLLAQAADALSLAKRWEDAVRVNQRLLGFDDIPTGQRAETFERLGHAYGSLGQQPEALEYFELAVRAGRENWRIRRSLGLVLYRLGRWDDAREQFLLSLDEERNTQTLIYVGRSFKESSKTGLSIYYLQQSLADVENLRRAERIDLYNELGYLYAEEAEYRRAAESWSRSLELSDDSEISLRFGRVQRLAGLMEEAQQTLEAIKPEDLSLQSRAQRLDELAAIYLHTGELGLALETVNRAIDLEPSSARFYALGLLHRNEGRLEEAREVFLRALEEDPDNVRCAVALGYTLIDLDEHSEAIVRFEWVLEREPDFLQLYEQLGYLNMKAPNNDRAQMWFELAIDNAPLYPIHNEEEEEALHQDIYRLRQEVTKISNRFDLMAYLSYRSGGNAPIVGPSGTTGVILPSQGGLELTFQPPSWGFRDERILQLFARVLWNTEPDSIRWEDESFQGGFGARYKPLRSQSLYVSGERLFKIGDNSQNNWLLRGLYSWDYGYQLRPGIQSWDYTFLYSEIDYLVQDPKTWVYYGEGRQGWTFNFSESFLLTPHVIVDGRYQDPGSATSTYLEWGGGASFKLLFNETRYQAYRSSFEILVQYRWGRYLGGVRPLEGSSFQGWVIGGLVRF